MRVVLHGQIYNGLLVHPSSYSMIWCLTLRGKHVVLSGIKALFG